MSGTSSLLQLWQIPSTKLLFTRSRVSKGLYMVPGTDFYPALCFCRNMQTATYEIVNGSYVPTAETKQNKIKLKARVHELLVSQSVRIKSQNSNQESLESLG